jgi:hypothetical protein
MLKEFVIEKLMTMKPIMKKIYIDDEEVPHLSL